MFEVVGIPKMPYTVISKISVQGKSTESSKGAEVTYKMHFRPLGSDGRAVRDCHGLPTVPSVVKL